MPDDAINNTAEAAPTAEPSAETEASPEAGAEKTPEEVAADEAANRERLTHEVAVLEASREDNMPQVETKLKEAAEVLDLPEQRIGEITSKEGMGYQQILDHMKGLLDGSAANEAPKEEKPTTELEQKLGGLSAEEKEQMEQLDLDQVEKLSAEALENLKGLDLESMQTDDEKKNAVDNRVLASMAQLDSPLRPKIAEELRDYALEKGINKTEFLKGQDPQSMAKEFRVGLEVKIAAEGGAELASENPEKSKEDVADGTKSAKSPTPTEQPPAENPEDRMAA